MTAVALVIDDSRTIRLILGKMLTGLGFEVASAPDGVEALEVITGGLAPDLILVDWNMPGMTGLEFIETVRRPPISATGKILMITTETELDRMMTALESGADEYLMKPFTSDAVTEKLQLLGFEV